jgi:hypothetical protein
VSVKNSLYSKQLEDFGNTQAKVLLRLPPDKNRMQQSCLLRPFETRDQLDLTPRKIPLNDYHNTAQAKEGSRGKEEIRES